MRQQQTLAVCSSAGLLGSCTAVAFCADFLCKIRSSAPSAPVARAPLLGASSAGAVCFAASIAHAGMTNIDLTRGHVARAHMRVHASPDAAAHATDNKEQTGSNRTGAEGVRSLAQECHSSYQRGLSAPICTRQRAGASHAAAQRTGRQPAGWQLLPQPPETWARRLRVTSAHQGSSTTACAHGIVAA